MYRNNMVKITVFAITPKRRQDINLWSTLNSQTYFSLIFHKKSCIVKIDGWRISLAASKNLVLFYRVANISSSLQKIPLYIRYIYDFHSECIRRQLIEAGGNETKSPMRRSWLNLPVLCKKAHVNFHLHGAEVCKPGPIANQRFRWPRDLHDNYDQGL